MCFLLDYLNPVYLWLIFSVHLLFHFNQIQYKHGYSIVLFTNSMDMSLSKLQEIVKHREAWCAVAHAVAKSWTQLSN